MTTAAVREVYEETGVPVRIDGILRVEHAPSDSNVRMRVLFTGTPLDDTEPKTTADEESLGAAVEEPAHWAAVAVAPGADVAVAASARAEVADVAVAASARVVVAAATAAGAARAEKNRFIACSSAHGRAADSSGRARA